MELTPEQQAYLSGPPAGSFYRPLWDECLAAAISHLDYTFTSEGNTFGVPEDVPPTIDQVKYRLLVQIMQDGGFGTWAAAPYRRATGQD